MNTWILASLQTGVGQIPSLSSLDFNYRVEPQFGARLLMACAGESGGSPLEYQEKLATHAAAGLDQIYAMEEVGQSLSQSVRAFYQQWGDFYLTAHPASPIGMLNLLFMQPDELTQVMKISIRINNNPVQYLKPGPAQQRHLCRWRQRAIQLRRQQQCHWPHRPARPGDELDV